MRRIIIGIVTACVIALGLTGSAAFATSTAAPTPAPALRVFEYGTNAPGKDTTGNRNAEFVRLVNTTGAALDVEGWKIHDAYQNGDGEYSNGYTLKASALPDGSPFKVTADHDSDPTTANTTRFVVPAGGQVYLYNGSGFDSTPTNNTAAIYRNFKHVYNNGGDTIYVRNAAGAVVAYVIYTPYRVKIG